MLFSEFCRGFFYIKKTQFLLNKESTQRLVWLEDNHNVDEVHDLEPQEVQGLGLVDPGLAIDSHLHGMPGACDGHTGDAGHTIIAERDGDGLTSEGVEDL